jgi:hypothetical protein
MILSEEAAKIFLISLIGALLAIGLSRQEDVLKCSEKVFNMVVSTINERRGFLDYAYYGPVRPAHMQ